MTSDEPTTRTLLRKAREGDRAAMEALFARSYPDLVQAARFRMGAALRARMDTLDLAQDAYFDAFRDLERYRYRGKGSFRRWLLGILENKIRSRLDFLRARKRDARREVVLEERQAPPAPVGSPTQEVVRGEDRERLERAMDRLPERYRDVIVSRYYLRMSWREIGELTSRSEEAAQMLCHRALRKLRAMYGEE